jgi:hypothetical protein
VWQAGWQTRGGWQIGRMADRPDGRWAGWQTGKTANSFWQPILGSYKLGGFRVPSCELPIIIR